MLVMLVLRHVNVDGADDVDVNVDEVDVNIVGADENTRLAPGEKRAQVSETEDRSDQITDLASGLTSDH